MRRFIPALVIIFSLAIVFALVFTGCGEGQVVKVQMVTPAGTSPSIDYTITP